MNVNKMQLPANFNEQKKPQLFEGLSENSLQTLLQRSVMQDYETGKVLVQQGDNPECVFLVLAGSLKTTRINEDGGEAIIRMLEAGDTCMEAVLFMGIPSPINVQAMSAAKILKIPDSVVKKHVLEDPAFAVNLLRIVSRHYKNAMHQIEAMNIKSPLQRVGYYFLLKHIEQGHENLDFKLPFKKTGRSELFRHDAGNLLQNAQANERYGHQSGRRYNQDAGFICALSFLRF